MSSEQMSLTGGKLIDSKAPDQNAPGWGWQQPKAREEYERSYAHVLDRDFSLRGSRVVTTFISLIVCR